jgi:hypothetical protein
MGHIHQRLELGEAQCFQQDADRVLCFKDRHVVPKDLSFAARSWMKLIALGILFIQEPTRCIKIWRTSGGHEWSERLQNMCLNVTHVKESKLIIWDSPEIYNPWAFLSENGKISVWTSLWVCPAPRGGTTRYGSLWIAWRSLPTLYMYPPPTGLGSIQSYICRTSSTIMAYRRPLFLTDDLSLLLAFGSNYMSVWAPILFEDQPITPRLMDRLSESINHWRYALCLCSD